MIILLVFIILLSSSATGSLLSSTSSIPSLFQESEKTYSMRRGINLVKCCPPNNLYKTGLNYCRPSGKIDTSWDRALLIPVHSITTNETLVYTDLTSSHIQFQLNINLVSCPKGFLGKTSTKFRFYEDGTLKFDLDGMRYNFLPGEFCIDQTSLSSDDRLIARFCIPSQCDDYESLGGFRCIRKCCPLGSVVNRTTKNCQSHSASSSFNNDVNHQVREYRNGRFVQIDNFTIVDGVAPHCLNDGRQRIKVSQFYLLKDGRMYNPNFPCQNERATEEYCIDHVIYDEQGTIRLEGIRCFTNVFTSTNDDSKRSLQIYPYFLLISSFFLVATIAVYIVIPEIRDNIHGVSTICYFACTALFYVSLAMVKLGAGIDQDKHETNSLCKPLAICAHFYFLSTFTWLNVVGFDLWWTFKTFQPITDGKNRHQLGWRFVIYSIYAWGIPLIIVLVGQILDWVEIDETVDETVRPKFGFLKCWFMCKESFLVYLYLPVAVLILFNVIFFCLTAIVIHKTSSEAESALRSWTAKQRYKVIFNLFIMMGISWSTEVVSFILDGSFYSWFLTDLINSLMGFIIFVIFVCKARIWRLLLKNCPWLKNLFSSFELDRGRATRRPQTATSASALPTLMRINRDESIRSNDSNQSIVMILNSLKIIRSRSRPVSPQNEAEATSPNVIYASPESRVVHQTNQIESTSL